MSVRQYCNINGAPKCVPSFSALFKKNKTAGDFSENVFLIACFFLAMNVVPILEAGKWGKISFIVLCIC